MTYCGVKDNDLGCVVSDFGGDHVDRKSTTGYVFKVADVAVSWRSENKTIVSLPTIEAEYAALSTFASKSSGY